ncbi:intermembrane lipid transfer protein VPS13C-like [Geothlypis trichas]
MELALLKYQGKDWHGHLKICDGMCEFFPVRFTSQSSPELAVDVYIHAGRLGGHMVLSVFSPYWIINKTSRVLQYRAEDTHVKHPADYRDIVLFSFKKKNILVRTRSSSVFQPVLGPAAFPLILWEAMDVSGVQLITWITWLELASK